MLLMVMYDHFHHDYGDDNDDGNDGIDRKSEKEIIELQNQVSHLTTQLDTMKNTFTSDYGMMSMMMMSR
jgi:hypothetical protein